MRNVLAHTGKCDHRVISAFIGSDVREQSPTV
jgi:hypothetical protein